MARAIRSTPSRSLEPRFESATCRSPGSTAASARSVCWSTIAAALSPIGPASSHACAGSSSSSGSTSRHHARSLAQTTVLARLDRSLADRPEASARISRDLVGRIRDLTAAIGVLGREIESLIGSLAPSLMALPGCGHLTAAKLVGETGGIDRFRSRAAFATHNGTAPVPVWSGNNVRHRLNRGGNRQLNLALHRIAVTQLRLAGPGRDYVAKRIVAGDTKTEAIRALKRRISDEVFRRLTVDEATRGRVVDAVTAAA
ncbi:MAG TPA: transposase [Candidatus Limnocylindrales bacterium]|nr:transposase [Candidatus Limnocylindrales bacterium]